MTVVVAEQARPWPWPAGVLRAWAGADRALPVCGVTPGPVRRRLVAGQLRAAQAAGDVDAGVDADLAAAGLLALTSGLGSSVLGGQRDGAATTGILMYHLDRLFEGQASQNSPSGRD